jgi:biopolymer transport protein ExbD
MARKELEEINAGSMADIAFLLLIFFLVTTTMEREKAIIRHIPIPIENALPPPPSVVEARHILEIEANNANEIFVRGNVIKIENISDAVEQFYMVNREGVVDDNSTYYTFGTEEDYKKEIPDINKSIEELSQQSTVMASQMLALKYTQLETAEAKVKALSTYKSLTGRKQLPEIWNQAHIKIIVMPKTTYFVLASIHAEVQEALFKMRDRECEKLFKTSYASLRRKNDNDQFHKEGKDELYLLDLLFPENIVEKNPNKQ